MLQGNHHGRWARSVVLVTSFSLLLLSFPSKVYAAEVELFFDDFEDRTLDAWDSGMDPAWTNGSASAHSGTRKARLAGMVENAILQKSVSTVGHTQVTVSFWYDTSASWGSNDMTEVQWTMDGSAWETILVLDEDDATPLVEGGDEWIEKTAELPANAANSSQFGLRFVGTINDQSSIFYLDDVRVVAEDGGAPTPTVTPTMAPIPTTAPPSPTPTVSSPTPTPTKQPIPTSQPTPTQHPTAAPEPTVPPSETGNQLESFRSFFRLLIQSFFLRIWALLWTWW